MSEYFAIFDKRTGRQVTAAHDNAAALAQDGREWGVVTVDRYGFPHVRPHYERRPACAPRSPNCDGEKP